MKLRFLSQLITPVVYQSEPFSYFIFALQIVLHNYLNTKLIVSMSC